MGYYSRTDNQIAVAADYIQRTETNLSSSVTGVGCQVCTYTWYEDVKHKITLSDSSKIFPPTWGDDGRCTGDYEYQDYECIRRCDLLTYHDIWVCCINNFTCTYPVWTTSYNPAPTIAKYKVDAFIRKIRFELILLKRLVRYPNSYDEDPTYISGIYIDSDLDTTGSIGSTKEMTIYVSSIASAMFSAYNRYYPGVFKASQGYCGGTNGVHSVFVFGNDPDNNMPTEYYLVGVRPKEFWISPNAGKTDYSYTFSSITSASDLKATHTEIYINTSIFANQYVSYHGGVFNSSLLYDGSIYCTWPGSMQMHFCKAANCNSELFNQMIYTSYQKKNFKKIN